jgi:hypothetical protein
MFFGSQQSRITASSSSAAALNNHYLLLPAELRSNCAKLKGKALEPSSDAASCYMDVNYGFPSETFLYK